MSDPQSDKIPIPRSLLHGLISFLNHRMERDRFLQEQCHFMQQLRFAEEKADKVRAEEDQEYVSTLHPRWRRRRNEIK
jgi:hypothetical protein